MKTRVCLFSLFVLLLTLTCPIPIRAQEGPQIESFFPQGTVKHIRQVQARFSEPMVPFGDPRAVVTPFDVDCSEKGTAHWADDKNWIYDFDRDLPAGVRCQFRLKAGIHTLSGKELTGQRTFLFSTGGPAILSSMPYEGDTAVDSEQVFILELDAEPTEESVLRYVSFAVEGIRDRIGVRLVSGQERTKIVKSQYPYRKDFPQPMVLIQAKQRFPENSKVTLVWSKGVTSKSGVATEQDQELPFKTRSPFSVTFHCQRENPQAECIPFTPMYVSFSAPVSWPQARNVVLQGPGRREWKPARAEGEEDDDKFVRSVAFKGPFPEKAQFRIQIPRGLKDDAGRTVVNASQFPLTVRTDEYPPLAKFSARFGILEKADPVLPVTLRNLEADIDTGMLKVSEAGDSQGTAASTGEEVKGRIYKVPPDRAEQILPWLRKIYRRDDQDQRDKSIFGTPSNVPPTGLKRFILPKPNGAKAFEVVGIPLKEPGFYVVELESAILGSSLIGKSKRMFVPTTALVTNLGVHFKWGLESSLVWVTSLDSAKPVKDAVINIRDCSGSVLWKGATDANGVGRIDKLPARDKVAHCAPHPLEQGLFVTARTVDDLAFVHSSWDEGIEPWRFQLPTEWDRELVSAHTVFDRSLLRAGETVHMKHMLRKRATGGFLQVADAERPKSVQIEHAGSGQKYEFPLKWSPNGIAETAWTIPKGAKLGLYQVSFLRQDDKDHRASWNSGTFRVEEYRVPLMRGIIQSSSGPLVAPSDVTVDLAVRYLAGGAATNLPVKLRHQVKKRYLGGFEGFDDFVFANGAAREGIVRWGGEEEEQQEVERKEFQLQSEDLTLDKAGAARAHISRLPKTPEPLEILAELEFKDPNGEMQTVSSHIPLWPGKSIVGIKPASWALSKNALKLFAAVVDLSGKPVAEAPVKIDLFQRKVYSHRKRLIGGFYAYEHSMETKRVKTLCEGKTDGKGLLICEAQSPVSGNVIVQATSTDDSGNPTTANQEIWVAGKDEWWFAVEDHDRMDVLPEKKRYEAGEKARFQVRMPFRAATALVTVEREGIGDVFIKELTGKEPVVEIPVKDSYAPNVYVSVFAVRGRVSGVQPTATVDLGRPAFKLGIAEISVGWKAHELKVKVNSDHQVYKIREKARVKVAVTRADGKIPPPGSEIALAAVDEGLLELMPNRSWDLLESMMGRRSYAVHTSSAQMHVIGKRHFGLKALPQGGGGGKQITRELFDTLLVWKGRIPLDAKGEAAVEVPLNDSLTSFRIVAVATGGTGLFGTGSTSIRSTQDLMILSGIAPVVRQGDRFRAQVTLRNSTDHGMNIEASAKVSQLGALKPQVLSLSAGEAREMGWEITAPGSADTLNYAFEAKEKNGASDRIAVSQKVVPVFPVRPFQATIAQLENTLRMPVERPRDALSGGGVNVLFQPTLVDGLEGVKQYMRRYPYTCLEQKISQAVALRDERLWKTLMADLPSFLDSDGLAKYFPSMLIGSDTLTSYILAIAHEAGWEIPKESREKMAAGLRAFVEGKIVRYSSLPTADLSIRKLAAVEALSRWGEAEPQLLSSISVQPNLWPTSAVIDWFNVVHRVTTIANREQKLNGAEQILRSRLNFQGTIMGFSTERTDGLWWLMVSNDVNSVRLMLSLLESGKWMQDMPRIVRGVLARQQRCAWDLTVANAWGTLAVEKFSKSFEKAPVSGNSTATLAAKSQTVTWGGTPKAQSTMFAWPSKKEEIALTHTGTGKPWVTVQSLAAIPLKEPFSSGFRIKKTWIPVDQKEPGKWSRGDVVRVRLQLESQADMTWVVVSDPVPGGSTILGSGLDRDSALATRGEKHTGWVWPAFQERSFEAFRSYYEYVPKGEWTIEYTVRLNNQGTYHLPPARVEAMYSPEMFAEIPNSDVKVQ